jgi:uncharacterized protein (TIGR03435 family)
LALLTVAWGTLGVPMAFSQTSASPSPATLPATPPTSATPAAADPTLGITFDVVSIKHTEQGPSRVTNPGDGDGITITNSTLSEIIRWNFNVGTLRGDQIQGAPGWFSSPDENYEIQAKIAESDIATWQKLDDEARRLVFRKVLADRFKFASHFVDVEVPVYNLVIAKGGLKMKEAKPGEISPWKFHEAGDPSTPYSGRGMTQRQTPDGWITVYQRFDMETFATSDTFAYTVGRPVINKTGLTGVYNFSLDFSYQPLSASPSAEGGAPEPSSPDIFTALKTIGLKLEPGRGKVSHLVVDHLERPSED